MKKILAFTLAETLIVMGIIGIVSALTLPNLNSSTGEKEKVAKVKKIYRDLTDAYGRAQAVYGPMSDWFVNDSTGADRTKRFAERITEFMKVSKNCGNASGCWSTAPLLIDMTDQDNNNYYQLLSSQKYYFVMLADGTCLAFSDFGTIRVDIDGPAKGKTQAGNDIFDFKIDDDNTYLIPSYSPLNWTGNVTRDYLMYAYSTAWVIKNENLDYLKLDNSNKCPNGKQLNWETQITCK